MVAGLIVAEAAVAGLVFVSRRWAAVSAAVGAAMALGFWSLGQGFGQLLSGQSTDPNSGLLLLLMAVGVYGGPPSRRGSQPPGWRPRRRGARSS
jgi:hypothetical protein